MLAIVYADKGYAGAPNREFLAMNHFKDGIMRKDEKNGQQGYKCVQRLVTAMWAANIGMISRNFYKFKAKNSKIFKIRVEF
ncbi:MAG: hypothetical protein GY710_07975 [Desulfobacteraceae bacterium]|nr:hypothetical protein [Desulfobacteraceae bacterium]